MTSLLANTLSGSQIPRVSSYPPYSTSRPGQQAISIAYEAGLFLDPWQEYVLRNGLGQTAEGKWAARNVACIVPRQNGKGAIIEARQLAGLFIYKEELIIYTAHRFNTAESSFRRIMALCKGNPDLDRKVERYWTGSAKKGIELKPEHGGGFLRFLARSRDSARGLTANCLIFDEAYGLTFDEMAAIEPTASAVPNSQILYFSTPPLDPASGAPLYKVRERARNNDPRLAYFDWGADQDADLDDQAVWAETNPALGIRIELDTIAAERATWPEREFARERLGIWPEDESKGVVDPALWQNAKDEKSEALDPVAFAIDVAPYGASSSIGLASRRNDGRLHVELVDNRPGTSWVAERVKDLKTRWNPVAIAINPTSPLVAELEAEGIELLKVSIRDYASACEGFVNAIREDNLRHRGDMLIDNALMAAVTKPTGDGAWYWSRKLSVDISPLCAITLARLAYLAKCGEYRKPYNILDSVR